jgi:rubrerythrin
MREEESGHRRRLIELYRKRFGDHIPLIRRQDVRGFVDRRPVWLLRPLPLDKVRAQAASMELETRRFYEKASARSEDAGMRQLLDDLALEERAHRDRAEELGKDKLSSGARREEDETNRRLFLLQIVQPGLAGLMDGSVSTLAPVFAAAVATHKPWDAFLVGLAASIGAGISMGFAEALSDDGSLTGRGHPWMRGLICDDGGDPGGGPRTRRHLLDSPSVHGHPCVVRRPAGRTGRSAGVRHGGSDRQFVSATADQHQFIKASCTPLSEHDSERRV